MTSKIKLIVVTLVLAGVIAGLFVLLAPQALAPQESGAAQITRVTGMRSDVPEASLNVSESPPPTDMDVPTVDTMSQPDFKWF